jgi:hypothetical protein
VKLISDSLSPLVYHPNIGKPTRAGITTAKRLLAASISGFDLLRASDRLDLYRKIAYAPIWNIGQD